MMLKLYRIPWGYDYHKSSGLVVIAASKKAAITIGRAYWAKAFVDRWEAETEPDWEAAAVVRTKGSPSGQVYVDYGCDC